jgi:hypothetical protein
MARVLCSMKKVQTMTSALSRTPTPHAFFLQGSDGDVGIGTASPAEKLEVTGNIILDATDANIKIKSGVAGTAGAVNFTFNSDSTVYGSSQAPSLASGT